MSEKQIFEIDFFEFAFLVEACIPPRPIARAMFWDKVINEFYHQLTDGQRKKLFKWIQLNPSFDVKNEDCKWFYDRFNPDNQYTVITKHNGEIKKNDTFKHNESYCPRKDSYIVEDFIIDVERKGVLSASEEQRLGDYFDTMYNEKTEGWVDTNKNTK